MSDLPEILIRAFQDKQVFTPDGRKAALHSNIAPDECRVLNDLVRRLKPAVSVEIGFAQGVSTLAILQAIADNGRGHHHVIDPFQSTYENCGLAMVERAGLGAYFSFHESFAEEVIPHLPRVQFAFIDSSHLFDLTIAEFVLVDKRLEPGGCVGLHDMWMPAQQAAVRYILANRSYVIDEASTPSRQAAERGAKGLIRNLARSLPGAERTFSGEFLNPWKSFGLPNIVILRKTAEDKRDWAFHVRS